MQTANVNRIYELLEKINNKLDNLDLEVHEIKKEMGLEIKPEYIKKLNEMEKESDISFNSMKEFDKHFGFEDV